MYQAENENKIRIEAEEATKGLKYFCPCCGKEVILKQGDVVTWHFAHKSSKECDSWYSMSKWHEEWQKKFNKKYREVVIERDGEKHRADVKIDHLVFEFQHSNISAKEFKKRTNFYSKDGYIIWLFDVRGADIRKEYKGYRWYHYYKFIDDNTFEELENIFIFLQIEDNKIYEPRRGTTKFSKGKIYTKNSFMQRAREIYNIKNILDKDYRDTKIKDCILKRHNFKGVEISNVIFETTDFYKADFSNCILKNCVFTTSKFEYANFKRCKIIDCAFYWNDMRNINLEGAEVTNSSFIKGYMIESNLQNSNFKKCIFQDTDIRKTTLTRAMKKDNKFQNTYFDIVNK